MFSNHGEPQGTETVEIKTTEKAGLLEKFYISKSKAIAGEVFQKDGEVSLDTEADR
jgi:hypothetical protein